MTLQDAADALSKAGQELKSFADSVDPDKDNDIDGLDPDNDVPVDKQPKTLDEARVKVREHFRKARAAAKQNS